MKLLDRHILRFWKTQDRLVLAISQQTKYIWPHTHVLAAHHDNPYNPTHALLQDRPADALHLLQTDPDYIRYTVKLGHRESTLDLTYTRRIAGGFLNFVAKLKTPDPETNGFGTAIAAQDHNTIAAQKTRIDVELQRFARMPRFREFGGIPLMIEGARFYFRSWPQASW